jgi:hypothetical protein
MVEITDGRERSVTRLSQTRHPFYLRDRNEGSYVAFAPVALHLPTEPAK